MRAATTKKAKYTSYTNTVGWGKYCANRPAMSGPRPSPPVLATVATMDARRGFADPNMSVSAAVAVPVIRPAEKPDRTRPKKSHPTAVAMMNTTVLRALNARAAPSTGLRPTWSDACPAKTRAASTPAAYAVKISVITSEEKCHWLCQMTYSGVGRVVPSMVTANT